MTECNRCLYDESIADISFDEKGLCNYCIRHEALEKEYPNDSIQGKFHLESLFSKIKKAGYGKKYDCVVGISGGCDSSYLLDLTVKHKLRPLAVHFDNGWDTEIAIHNMNCVCEKLGVDLVVRKANPAVFDDIVRSFMLAGVVDIDCASDIGMITVMYQEAEANDISYIVEGHSFRTEGIQPLHWAYVDGMYISDVHQKYGQLTLKDFPILWYEDFVRWVNVCKIERVRPLYYEPYIKSEAQTYLKDTFGWKKYKGHHLENEFTAFNYTYFLPQKMGVDERINEFSALIRSGQMDKTEAKRRLEEEIHCSAYLMEKVKKRLELDDNRLKEIMGQPLKTYQDYTTYKQRFEKDREFWEKKYLEGAIPKSFYLKYCFASFR